MPVPKFGFLRKVGKFINRTANRILGRADVAVQSEKLVRLVTAEHLTPLAVSLSEGSMTLPAWQTEMRQTIKRLYVNQYTLARGGKVQMTFQDYGRLSQMLQDQYKYLDKYAAQLATMDVAEREAYIRNRSQLYANASNEAFERGKSAVAQSLGFDECNWNMTPAEHCDTCLRRAALGPQPIGPRGGFMDPEDGEVWPADGSSICLTNDRCYLSYSNSETGAIWEEAAGPGSGWWGPPTGTHGPGSQGGSGVEYRADSYRGITMREPTDAERKIIEDTISGVRKTVPSLDGDTIEVAIAEGTIRPNGTGPFGISTKEGMIISPTQIDMRLADGTLTTDWLGMPQGTTLTRTNVLEHVVAHEMGHRWWNRQSKTTYGTNIRGERTRTITPSKTQQSWEPIHASTRISGYSNYYKDSHEAFADAFAGFTTGLIIPDMAETFMWEKVR